jgi:hypothetical protein
MDGRSEKCMQKLCLEKSEERDLGIDRMILKWILNWFWRCGLDSYG